MMDKPDLFIEQLVQDHRPKRKASEGLAWLTTIVLHAALGAAILFLLGPNAAVAGSGFLIVGAALAAAGAFLVASAFAVRSGFPGRAPLDSNKVVVGLSILAIAGVCSLAVSVSQGPEAQGAGLSPIWPLLFTVVTQFLSALAVCFVQTRLAPANFRASAILGVIAATAFAWAILPLQGQIPASSQTYLVATLGGILGAVILSKPYAMLLGAAWFATHSPVKAGRESLVSAFSTLPASLKIMTILFTVVPFWSLTFLDDPVTLVRNGELMTGALILGAYWVIPLLIVGAVLKRHFLLVPMFVLECLGLILHSVSDMQWESAEIQTVRIGMLGVMAGLTFVFVRKDFLYPLMAKQFRHWRGASRLYLNARLKLSDQTSGASARAVMENCSLTGLGLSGSRTGELQQLLGSAQIGKRIQATVVHRGRETKIEMEMVWLREDDATIRAGFRALDEDAMASFVRSLRTQAQVRQTIGAWLNEVLVASSLRRAALAIWVLAIIGSFGTPSCNVVKKDAPAKPGVLESAPGR